jgi:hypothetical protein
MATNAAEQPEGNELPGEEGLAALMAAAVPHHAP